MFGFMCLICFHTFISRIGYSQHRNSCVKTIDYDNDSQMPLNPYSKSHSFMKDFKNIQDNNRPNNFSQIASKKEILCNISKDIEVDNDMLFELEDENDISFEVAANNNKEFFQILQNTLQNFKILLKK
ncbi:hypothetical protein F8M41_019359 [Gigaspora margarita]|uniref:C2H2-type domain-containing protein n=1 Tax=Gigaspora margarita TaxID=4874 RepID=A0A8H4B5E5_GIGMA|nr:hypothetical protein F8M41_019359 [Gigaspora margarita]